MPRFDLMVRNIANRLDRWQDHGMGASYRKRAQFKTITHLKALAEELGGDLAEFRVRGQKRTLQEIGKMEALQLSELSIYMMTGETPREGYPPEWRYVISFSNGQEPALVKGTFVTLQAPTLVGDYEKDRQNMAQIMAAKQVVETYTQVVPKWRARSKYPVVQTIDKDTDEQRAYEKRLGRRTAWLSLLVSAPVGAGTAWLTAVLTPR